MMAEWMEGSQGSFSRSGTDVGQAEGGMRSRGKWMKGREREGGPRQTGKGGLNKLV